jgi:hypothetical protein
MPKQTHCKFRCTGIASYDPTSFLSVKLEASYDKENIDDRSFSKATPSGMLDTGLPGAVHDAEPL